MNEFKIDSTIDSNSTENANASLNSNSNANVNANMNANANQRINSDIEMKNRQIEQNNYNEMQTIMKTRIEKSIDTKMKKI